MKFWASTAFSPPDHYLPLARAADEAGVHGIMMSDHIFYPRDLKTPYPYSADGTPIWPPETAWPDNWVTIGAMAAVTERVQFGTSVYIAPARDLFTDDIEKIIIDDREEYIRLRRFVETFMPERVTDIEYYDGAEPIFDAFGIEDEIQRALARKVQLASGGHLIIDQAEALTAIDVNTGRFVGKGSKDLEETILTTNLDSSIDDAFRRRISFRVDFPMPEIEDRERLWRSMLPQQADVSPNIDFLGLATKFEFSGGYISNAVLRAAFFAADEGGPITQHHLQRAALLEYTSMGKIASAIS